MGLVFTTCTGTRGSGAPIGTGSYCSASAADDSTGPSSGTFRVLRGGSWISGADIDRSAGRGRNSRASAAATRVFVLRGLSGALGCGGLTVCGLTFCFYIAAKRRELFSDFDIFQPEWSCSASRTYSRSFLPGRTNVLRPAEKAGTSHRFPPEWSCSASRDLRQVLPAREGRMCSDRQRRPAASSPIRRNGPARQAEPT